MEKGAANGMIGNGSAERSFGMKQCKTDGDCSDGFVCIGKRMKVCYKAKKQGTRDWMGRR